MTIAWSTRLSAALIAGMIPVVLYAFSSGPPSRVTGAPGDAPFGCATGACHTAKFEGGPINFYGGSVKAEFSSGTTYTPGTPVTITVRVSDPVAGLIEFNSRVRPPLNLEFIECGVQYTAGPPPAGSTGTMMATTSPDCVTATARGRYPTGMCKQRRS